MKCICGYEQPDDFENHSELFIVDPINAISKPIIYVCPRCGTIKTKLDQPIKLCGDCDKTDGLYYTSNPPKVRCSITGRYHFYGDKCDCEREAFSKK